MTVIPVSFNIEHTLKILALKYYSSNAELFKDDLSSEVLLYHLYNGLKGVLFYSHLI